MVNEDFPEPETPVTTTSLFLGISTFTFFRLCILAPLINIEFAGSENISFDLLKKRLSSHINFLIQSDFQKLVSILYRVDVNESKLKHLLKENQGFDAANIITDLIIERELQKIRSRQEYRNNENISDDEKW